ncbi:MAG TPA: MFS transporter [archaeon]|nr:MFS transporter [archaeon]
MKSGLEGNIWKLYLSWMLISFWFILPVTILFLQNFGISYFEIGVLEFLSLLIMVIFEIPTGAFADIFGRRNSVVLGIFVTSLGIIVTGFGSVFVIFLVGYIIWGLGYTFVSGAVEALIFDTLKDLKREKEYLKIMGKLHLYSTITLIIGLFVGPILFAMNVRLPYIMLAVFFSVSGFVFLSMKEPKLKKKKITLKNHYNKMKEGMKYTLSHKEIKWLIVFSVILLSPIVVVNSLMLQPFLMNSGFDIISFSIIFPIIYGLGGLASAFAYKIEKIFGEKSSFFLVILVQGISFLLMSAINTPTILIVVVLLYLSRNYGYIVIDNYINHHTKSSVRATLISIWSMITSLFMAFLNFATGYMLDIYGINTMLLILGSASLIIGLPYLWRRYR